MYQSYSSLQKETLEAFLVLKYKYHKSRAVIAKEIGISISTSYNITDYKSKAVSYDTLERTLLNLYLMYPGDDMITDEKRELKATITQLIAGLIEKQGTNVKDLAKRMDKSPTIFYNIIKPSNDMVGVKNLRETKDYLGALLGNIIVTESDNKHTLKHIKEYRDAIAVFLGTPIPDEDKEEVLGRELWELQMALDHGEHGELNIIKHAYERITAFNSRVET